MIKRSKNILIFIITILLAISVYIWFYPLNKGILNVTTDQQDYYVFVDGNAILCKQNPCSITLKSSSYNIRVQKDKYFPETNIINIKRGKSSNLEIQLQIIPNLTVSSIVPQNSQGKTSLKLPDELKNANISAPAWNHSGDLLAFIDKNDDRLKIWKQEGDIKPITKLKNVEKEFRLLWSPNSSYLLGTAEKNIYFINVTNTTRTKQNLGFSPQNTVWSLDSAYLLANDQRGNLHKINFEEQSIALLDEKINLNQSVWDTSRNELIFFQNIIEENKVFIYSFNPGNQEKTEIIAKYNFPINKISADINNTIYFYNSDTETWYQLN